LVIAVIFGHLTAKVFNTWIIPLFLFIAKLLPKKKETTLQVIEDNDTPNEKEEIPKQSTESIRQNYTKLYIEKQTAKINLFLKYSQWTMVSYITLDEMLLLDECIRCYAFEESLPEGIITISPIKLKNPDMFHFGWNMTNYFGFPKHDVVPWLQQVFTELQELEYSTIYGKLGHTPTGKQTIPIIDDIPKYLAELNI
jgi:hypothetical protein